MTPISSTDAGVSWPPLTVAVINLNGTATLPFTLDALRAADYPGLRVMLVDDQSTDGSVELVRSRYPEVEVHVVPQSKQRPSVVRNLAIQRATTPFLMLLDNDIALRPDCLRRLMTVMVDRPAVFRVVPRLVYHDNPELIYMDGGALHYLAISARSDRGKSVAVAPPGPPVPSIGCGIPLLRRDIAMRLGGFDEGYHFGWGEDAELIVRARLLGFEALTVQDAIGLHVEKSHGTGRAEAQFYNRYRLMWINYSTRALVLLTPALFCFDLMLMAMGFMKGLTRLQFKAMRTIWADRADILARRRWMQQHRAVGDRSLLEGTPLAPTGVLRQSKLVQSIARWSSVLFVSYWRLVRDWLHDGPFRGRPVRVAALDAAAEGLDDHVPDTHDELPGPLSSHV